MIIKIFNTSGRTGRDCINYLLGSDFKRAGASVVIGFPILTANIIDSLKFKKSYICGCLSFNEKKLDIDSKLKIINLFMRCVRGELQPHQINFLWVEHVDKENLELNFVIPCVDLVSLRHIDLLLYHLDRDFCRVFCDYVNAAYGLSSPKDPINRRDVYINHYDSEEDKNLKKYLHGEAKKNILNGKIRSQDDLVEFLENYQLNFLMAYKKSFSLRKLDDNKVIFLKGPIFEKGFNFSKDSITNADQESVVFREDNIKNINYFYGELIRLVKHRGKRYKRFELDDAYRIEMVEKVKMCVSDELEIDDLSFIEDLFFGSNSEKSYELDDENEYEPDLELGVDDFDVELDDSEQDFSF